MRSLNNIASIILRHMKNRVEKIEFISKHQLRNQSIFEYLRQSFCFEKVNTRHNRYRFRSRFKSRISRQNSIKRAIKN
jgi:hypothetical protein